MPTVSLTNEANVTDNGTLMLDKAVAVKMVEVGGTSYLLAMGTLEGISVFEANADGSLTNVFNVADSGPFQLSGGRDLAVADVGGTTYVFAAGSIDDGVSVFSMGTDGSLTNVANIADSGTVNLNGAQSLATAVVGGTTYLTVAGADDNGISVFSVATDGTLTHTGNADDDGTLALADVRSLETITVGSNSYVIGAGYDDNGISAFKINSDGTLTHTETISDSGSMNLTGASAITTATVNGTGYVFVGSSTDNGISVFSIDSNGNLANVANTGSSVLSAIKGMDVFEYNGQTYLAASGSSSNTVKLYEVANDGSLTQAYSLSDNGTINLNNVWGIDAASVGGEQHLYVSAFSDSGISSFDLNTAPEIALSPTNVAYTEGALPITTSGTSLVSDADGNEWNGGTLTAQLDGSAGISDVLSFSDTDGSSVTITVSGTNILANGVDIGDISHSGGTVSGTDVLEITFNGNATEGIVREVVQSLAYQNTSDDPTSGQETATREITVTVADNAGAASSASGTILVVPANDDPSMSDLPTSIDVTEDVASNIDLSAATFSDPDSGSNVITLSLAVEAGTLAASDTGGVTVADSGTAQITLTGTVSNLDTYLNTSSSIQYTSAENDDTSTTLTIVANDGGNTGYGGGTDVVVGTTTLNIAAINDDPTATGVDDVFVSGAEGQSISVDMSGVVLADVDANGAELTLSFDVLGEGGLTLSDGADVTVSGSSVTGTIDNLQSYLATPSNIQYLNNGEDSGDTIRVYLNDNGNTGTGGGTAVEVGLIDVTLSPTNDDPVVTGLPADLDVTEDEVSDLDLSPIAITDVDAGAQDITLTLTVDSGVLIAGDSGGVIVGDTDTAQITLTGSVSELNAYLNDSGSVQYQSAENDDTSATLTVVINDGGNTGAGGGQDILVGTTTLNIAAINDAPTMDGLDSVTVEAIEGTPSNVDMSGVTISDVDANGGEITLWLDPGEGQLIVAEGAGVTLGSGDGAHSVTGTIPALTSYLSSPENIQYLNETGEDATDGILVYLSDNGNTGTGGGTPNLIGSIELAVTQVNDDPVMTALPATINVTEDVASNIDLSAATLSDVDAGSNPITLTLNVDSGTLAASDVAGVTVADSGTAQITLTGTVSDLDEYLNTASNIQYTGAENDDTSATLTIGANDGGNVGTGGGQDVTLGTIAINIDGVNDMPTLLGLPEAPITTDEGVLVNIDLSDAVLADVDAGDGEVSVYLLPSANGEIFLAEGTGVTVQVGDGFGEITGTVDDINTYLSDPANIQYLNDSERDVSDTISISVNDHGNSGSGGGVAFSMGSIVVNVLAVNDDPVAVDMPTSISVTEDIASDVDFSGMTISDDAGVDDNITITLNVDAGTLDAVDANGVTVSNGGTDTIILTGTVSNLNGYMGTASNIQYTSAENDDTSATLTIIANDGGSLGQGGGGNVTLGTVELSIDPTNDAPTSTDATLTFGENSDFTLNQSHFGFEDVDSGDALEAVRIDTLPASGTLQLDGAGVTAGDVITVADIDAGLLTYSPPADTTGQAVASFTFTVNDGDTFAEASSTITFDGEPNTAPTLSLADTTIDHVEGAGASHLDAAAILEDADGDSDFQGATLTVQVTGQADADDQLFLSDDNGTGPVITVSGTDVLADGVDVGDVNMDGGLATGDAQLVINFDEDATQEIVQEVARAFVYETTSDTPSGDAKTVTVTLADAHTAMATDSVQVSITETNDDPVAAGLPAILGVKEDTQSEVDLSGITLADDAGENPIVLTLSVASGILDVTGESGPITVSGEGTSTITLEGTVEALNSYISDATRFVYLGAENDDTSTTLTLLANDGGNSGTGGGENVTLGTIALEIGAVNDAPTGADNQLTFTEDTNFTLQASHFGFADVDGDTLQTVRIASLPDSGTLTLDGTPVSGSDDIAVADIQAGLLRYQPEAGVTGDDVASFTFYVGDGKDLSDQENTITFDGQEASSGGGSGSGGSSGGGSTPDPEPIDQNLGDNGGTAVGSDLADTILGGAGDDTVSGGAGDDILPGGDGSDVISGGTGNDVLYAGAGDTGNDTLDGGEGADTVGGGAGDDVLSGGSGNDMVFAGLGNDVVAGGDGADLVFGGMGDDLIGGGDGSDMLFNGGGADTVDGGAGDDEIWAGAGDDLLTGGAGADTFMFGANSGNDTITDFSTADDLLDLRFTVTDFADASAVQAAASDATQSGVDGLLIDLGGGQSVFLQGLSMADFASLDITL